MFWLVGLALAAISTAQAQAQTDRFSYKLEMTPQQSRVDPEIEKRYTTEFRACEKRAVTTYENAACLETEFARQDAVLNQAWKIAFHRQSTTQRGALLKAQRKWVAERDPFCKTVSDGFRGGTIAPIVYSGCRVEQTIRRTIWLEALATSAPAASPGVDNPTGALKVFLKTYEHNWTHGETRYAVAWKDLNGDGRPEAVVYLTSNAWCGSGGCTLLVLERAGDRFIVRGRTTITRAPIAVLPSTSHGWRDLVVGVGGGGEPYGQVVLPFRGDRYASNPTLPPARRLGRHAAAEVLITDEDQGAVL